MKTVNTEDEFINYLNQRVHELNAENGTETQVKQRISVYHQILSHLEYVDDMINGHTNRFD